MEDAKRRSVWEAALMARLKRHRDNIARLEERKAKYGLNVPLELENELADERAAAMEVEAQLQHIRTGGDDPLDRLFHEATTARITGQVGRALQLYEQIQREDPTYPDITVHVMRTKQELGRGYVDNGGRVIPERVPPAVAPMPAEPARKEVPKPAALGLSPLMILILLAVCILLAIGLYLLLRAGL